VLERNLPYIFSVCVKEGSQYRGKRHYTASGRECIPWKDIKPSLSAASFPESTIDDAKNFCRNPQAKIKPYCYTNAQTNAIDYCNIEKCKYVNKR
jgi:apolipoprotein a